MGVGVWGFGVGVWGFGVGGFGVLGVELLGGPVVPFSPFLFGSRLPCKGNEPKKGALVVMWFLSYHDTVYIKLSRT